MHHKEDIKEQFKNIKSLFFVSQCLQDFPHAQLFLVGGSVRDHYLDRPIKDIDLVIRGVPMETLMVWLQKHGTVDVVGKTFGVIKFQPRTPSPARGEGWGGEGEICIDIALPRTEQALSDSLGGYRDIHAQSDPELPIETDLSRRDFTINAMAINLATGDLVDPFFGFHDLKMRTIRAVGDPKKRFEEDLTRIVRGIRFAAELGFEIESHTREAMKTFVPNLNHLRPRTPPCQKAGGGGEGEACYVVSRETIGEELSKAFFANPSRTVQLLQDLGALEELFPSVWRHTQVDAHYLEPIMKTGHDHPLPPSFIKEGESASSLERTIILLLRGLTPDEARTTLSFTGLDTIDKQSPRRIDVDHVLWMIQRLQQQHTPENITAMRASHFEKQFLGARGTEHMHLLEHLGHHKTVHAAKKRREEICSRWVCDEHEPIPPLITGDDVLRQGIPAGARVREILEMVRDNQLDGHILTREAAIRFVKQQME